MYFCIHWRNKATPGIKIQACMQEFLLWGGMIERQRRELPGGSKGTLSQGNLKFENPGCVR